MVGLGCWLRLCLELTGVRLVVVIAVDWVVVGLTSDYLCVGGWNGCWLQFIRVWMVAVDTLF